MAIAAHLDDTAETAGKPRQARRKLRLETRGALASGGASDVLVHNVSASGLLFEGREVLATGESIEIELPLAGATLAKIVWSSGNLYGCAFDAPISAAALSAAQLKGAAGIEVEPAGRQEAAPEASFGARLRGLRKARGLTLAQIAGQLGVSKPTVWAWEQGKARPVDGRIDALAAVLGVPGPELRSGGNAAGLGELLVRTRERIAGAFGTSPDKVRIMIEL